MGYDCRALRALAADAAFTNHPLGNIVKSGHDAFSSSASSFSVIKFFAEIGGHVVPRRGSRAREMGSVSDTVAETYDRLAWAEFAQGIGLGELFRPEPIALLAEMHAVARLDVERVAEE